MNKTLLIVLFCTLIIPASLMANGQQDADLDGKTKITWWMPGSGENTNRTWTILKERYMELHPDVVVEYALIPWSEYFTKLNASFVGGLAPDVFGLGYGQMGPVQANGNCLPLDDYLKDWDGWDDIPRNILDASKKDGMHWSVMMPDVKLFYYRKDLFDQAGLQPPKTPRELLKYAEIFTTKENGKATFIGFDISTSNGEQDYFNAFLMFGGESMWDSNNEPNYNTPTGLKTIEYLNEFIQNGLSVLSDEHSLVGGTFENGISAMNITAAGDWVKYTQKLGDKVGVAMPPGGITGSGATFLNVGANTDDPQAAVDFLKHLLSAESQRVIYQGEGRVPTRRSNKDWFLEQNEFAPVMFDALQNSRTYGTMNPYFFDFLNTFRPALEAVYYGQSSAEEAFSSAEVAYLDLIR